jgi:signal transduction histidine kinase
MAAAEDERRRWARELHDDTLQALGGLRLHLSSARRADDLQSWRRAGEEAIRQIENEILNLRAIITDLRPPALDQIGLAAAIGTLAEQHEAVSGLVIECALPAPQRSFGAELETTLYRLVQEALTNVAKHAQATRASVTVAAADANDDTGDDTGVYITVTDDGVGFDPAAPAAGFGLAGIRERVGLVGGTLTIESNGKGTTLSIAVPRAAAPAAEPGPGQLR